MILAVDPGLKGAFAVYGEGSLTVYDMPTYTKNAGSRNLSRDFIDAQGVLRLVREAHLLGCDLFVIEDVGGLPGQSASGAFVFGRGVGEVEMAARSIGMRLERVRAATWKAGLRVPADKRAARARASELMPQWSHLWPLQKHDGRAEAAMLALYAERFLLGGK